MRDNPLRLFDTKDARVAEVMAGAPKLLDHLSPAAQEHRERVLDGARSASASRYEEDPTLVRGFDYYTMTVFEFSQRPPGRPERGGRRRALRRPRGAARRARRPRASASAPASSGSRWPWARRDAGRRPGAARLLPDGARPGAAAGDAAGARAPAGGGAALRERPARRPQPEGHDAPRGVAGRPPRGDRGRRASTSAGWRRCATWQSGEQREVPLGDLVEALSVVSPLIGSRALPHPHLRRRRRPPGATRARGRLGPPPARPRRAWSSSTCATAPGCSSSCSTPRARGPPRTPPPGSSSPEDVVERGGRGGGPLAGDGQRGHPHRPRRAAGGRRWRCSPRPIRCRSRWRTRPRRPPRSCG